MSPHELEFLGQYFSKIGPKVFMKILVPGTYPDVLN